MSTATSAATACERSRRGQSPPRDRFQSELAIVRQQGYALDQEEYLAGVWCIAAPLLDGTAPPTTALSISMPTERYLQMRDRYVELILELARTPSSEPEEQTP